MRTEPGGLYIGSGDPVIATAVIHSDSYARQYIIFGMPNSHQKGSRVRKWSTKHNCTSEGGLAEDAES
jgi:hypothetical protein